ncbi:hypothetical protein M3I54_43865 [Paraburkholderia sp. CNPSo 3274]|uniref:hypothetical protein n=1 Tax=unclassified Paraburkholderia TaxID=2615204 RepID=UPI0020B82897|nr:MULTISPECIES: hypothetical protein [unclassified Paraburkholderia]MCP3713676.1 hypothetical protein [Paraburkholderia sp. CNPSo 3274]MCP3718440.1 hypothetical protein [Paraburkholderia sp. CNPSo 3281]
MNGKYILGKIDSDSDNRHGLPLSLVDERSQLHLGTLMPTRGFRRSLGTGKSLSFSLDYSSLEDGKIASARVFFDLAPLLGNVASSRIKTSRYAKSSLTGKYAEEKSRELHDLMRSKQGFLDSGITLDRVADQIGIHRNHLSQILLLISRSKKTSVRKPREIF